MLKNNPWKYFPLENGFDPTAPSRNMGSRHGPIPVLPFAQFFTSNLGCVEELRGQKGWWLGHSATITSAMGNKG